jgi:hypothetical protein
MTYTQLTPTQIQGMMQGCYEPLSELQITHDVRAVCLENGVWEVVSDGDELLGTVNPTAAKTCGEVDRLFAVAAQAITVDDVTYATPSSE